MMNMMNTTGTYGLGSGMVWLHIHWFLGGFAIIGFILLTVWALRTLSKEKLQSFTIWLLTIGIIGTLLTAPLAGAGYQRMMGSLGGYRDTNMMNGPMMEMMMKVMMKHDESPESEDHELMEDMMQEMMQGSMYDARNSQPGMMQ